MTCHQLTSSTHRSLGGSVRAASKKGALHAFERKQMGSLCRRTCRVLQDERLEGIVLFSLVQLSHHSIITTIHSDHMSCLSSTVALDIAIWRTKHVLSHSQSLMSPTVTCLFGCDLRQVYLSKVYQNVPQTCSLQCLSRKTTKVNPLFSSLLSKTASGRQKGSSW